MSYPILYSFRRCPYAIRARLAISVSQIEVELREVVLKYKPAAMLACSAKGTVPILQLSDGTVVDESYDIMHWALAQHDPEQWLLHCGREPERANSLITENDCSFKANLDRYKYADRHPQHTAEFYRAQGEAFLRRLEQCLLEQDYLMGAAPSLVDIAILPFVRQFAHVDKSWFEASPYQRLRLWLERFLQSSRFQQVMQKYPPWVEGDNPLIFPPRSN